MYKTRINRISYSIILAFLIVITYIGVQLASFSKLIALLVEPPYLDLFIERKQLKPGQKLSYKLLEADLQTRNIEYTHTSAQQISNDLRRYFRLNLKGKDDLRLDSDISVLLTHRAGHIEFVYPEDQGVDTIYLPKFRLQRVWPTLGYDYAPVQSPSAIARAKVLFERLQQCRTDSNSTLPLCSLLAELRLKVPALNQIFVRTMQQFHRRLLAGWIQDLFIDFSKTQDEIFLILLAHAKFNLQQGVVHGLETASQMVFGKSVANLTDSELAYLVLKVFVSFPFTGTTAEQDMQIISALLGVINSSQLKLNVNTDKKVNFDPWLQVKSIAYKEFLAIVNEYDLDLANSYEVYLSQDAAVTSFFAKALVKDPDIDTIFLYDHNKSLIQTIISRYQTGSVYSFSQQQMANGCLATSYVEGLFEYLDDQWYAVPTMWKDESKKTQKVAVQNVLSTNPSAIAQLPQVRSKLKSATDNCRSLLVNFENMQSLLNDANTKLSTVVRVTSTTGEVLYDKDKNYQFSQSFVAQYMYSLARVENAVFTGQFWMNLTHASGNEALGWGKDLSLYLNTTNQLSAFRLWISVFSDIGAKSIFYGEDADWITVDAKGFHPAFTSCKAPTVSVRFIEEKSHRTQPLFNNCKL